MGRPAKEGPRRTFRLDKATDERLHTEAERKGVDVSSELRMALRAYYGLDGGPGAQGQAQRLQRAEAAARRLEVAFVMLTEGKHRVEDFGGAADAVAALGAGPAAEVWTAWDELRAQRLRKLGVA